MPERLIPESQLKEEVEKAVRNYMAERFGIAQTDNKPRRFYPTNDAYSKLGYDNPSQLYDAVATGLLRIGKEVQDRRKPKAKLPRYYFDIEACQSRLKDPPEKRK